LTYWPKPLLYSLAKTRHREEKMKALNSLILSLILLCGAAVLSAQTPQWLWAVQAGGPTGGWGNYDAGTSIATDNQGNKYITGAFSDTVTFGSHTLTASGLYDIFVAKMDPSGTWLWAVKAGGLRYAEAVGIAVDDVGNAWVTGSIRGTVTFGSHTLTAEGYNIDVFVAKLDPSGNWLWAVSAGGTDINRGFCITPDGSGNAYVTGYFTGAATFGSQTLTASGDEFNKELFVSKLDSNGNWLWTVSAGGLSDDIGFSIAVDGAGNIWVSGGFYGTVSFGSHTLTTSEGDYVLDIFVAKLDPSGNWLWAVQAGGSGIDMCFGFALDGSGDALLTGIFFSTATFGNHSLTAGEWDWNGDIFVAKMDTSGNWLWVVQAGGTQPDCAYGIAVDSAGNAYVTGQYMGEATFGSHTLAMCGGNDLFAAKLDPSGNWLWAVKADGLDEDLGLGIALDGAGNVYVFGIFNGKINFGNHALTAIGNMDIFITKLGSGTAVEDVLAPQAVVRLHNAYPNPLVRGGSALIKTEIPERSTGILSIFNLRGQIVARHKLSPGTRQISFSGEGLPAGVYLYSLQCGDYRETRKLVLMK
jgi:hypothetical protein